MCGMLVWKTTGEPMAPGCKTMWRVQGFPIKDHGRFVTPDSRYAFSLIISVFFLGIDNLVAQLVE